MKPTCCAVILAGGRSSRMGRDKASLMLGGKTFLERIAAELDACGFEEKYVSLGSGSTEDYGKEDGAGTAENPEGEPGIRIPSGWTVVRDRFPDCGPLGGIHAALSSCRAEWALFVSCDTPLYCKELAELLMSELPEREAVPEYPGAPVRPEPPAQVIPELLVPVTPDGRWHMASAVYKRTLLPRAEEQLREGNFRLRILAGKNGEKALQVPLEKEHAVYADMLKNVNTEEEYSQIRKEELPREAKRKSGVII